MGGRVYVRSTLVREHRVRGAIHNGRDFFLRHECSLVGGCSIEVCACVEREKKTTV